MKLDPSNVAFLKLLARSPDEGDGWRRYNETTARMVLSELETVGDLVELDTANLRVRLTEEGKVVLKWLV